MIGRFTNEHLRPGQRSEGHRPHHFLAELIDAGSRDLRDPGIVIESVGESMHHDCQPITVIGWITVHVAGVGECFEDAVRRRTRQPDLLGNFGNRGAVALIERGQRIEAAYECSDRSGRFHGSVVFLVVVYEIRRVAEFRKCSCRSATSIHRIHMFLYA